MTKPIRQCWLWFGHDWREITRTRQDVEHLNIDPYGGGWVDSYWSVREVCEKCGRRRVRRVDLDRRSDDRKWLDGE